MPVRLGKVVSFPKSEPVNAFQTMAKWLAFLNGNLWMPVRLWQSG